MARTGLRRKQLTFVITVCCLAISFRLTSENLRTEKFSQTVSSSHTLTDGHFNKTFASVAIVLESENNSYTCKLPL